VPRNDKGNERERYYLMPGQGGSNARRRQRQLMVMAIITGFVLAGLMAFVMWYFERLKH
jgi:hypothetical protein